MKKPIYLFLFIIVFLKVDLYAQSEWLGKWQSDLISQGTEKVIMEYNFISDSKVSLSFYTDNSIPTEGRCISIISLNGSYSVSGPFLILRLDDKTLDVSILRFVSYNKSSDSKQQILEELRSSAQSLFKDYKEIGLLYVTHDDKDIISFIYGDGTESREEVFHRPKEPVVELFDIEEQKRIKSSADSESNILDNIYDKSDTSSPMLKMFKSLGIFGLYIILSILLIYGIKFSFARILSRSKSAKSSVSYRRCYYIVRFVLRIVVIIGSVLWIILLLHGAAVSNFIGAAILCGGGSLLLSILASLSLPMNFMTIEKFMREERKFILYLRGFKTDDYTPEMEGYAQAVNDSQPWIIKTEDDEAKKNPNLLPLSEKSLKRACKSYCQLYSVGLPEELESPEGCKRIYLDNENWQENVITLMKMAKYIFVCVHPNDNCIWEIKQCNNKFSDKTIYFVDDLNKLKFVRDKMGEDIPPCLMPGTVYRNHMIAYMKNGQVILETYPNTEIGLFETLNVFFN